MKKSDIIAMVNAGLLYATQHELSTAHSYKVFKLKSEVRKAFDAIGEAEEALRKDCGIEDGAAFDRRLTELRNLTERTAKEQKELDEMNKTLKGYIEQQLLLHAEEVTLDVKAMPYEEWVRLQNENKAKDINGKTYDIFSGYMEELLFGVLWSEPVEKEGE